MKQLCGRARRIWTDKVTPWLPLLTVLAIWYSVHVAKQANDNAVRMSQDSQELQRSLANDSHRLQEDLAEQGRQLQHKITQGSFLLSSNERYDKILEAFRSEQTAPGEPPTRPEALALFRRYWGLQHDQFQYFRDGFIDEQTYRFWLRA